MCIRDRGIAVPVREGYTFGGWALSPNGKTEYLAGQLLSAPDGLVLYAVWIPAESIGRFISM